MALWAGTAINTTETAMVFNQLYNLRALPMVRKKNGLLYRVLGKRDIGSTRKGDTQFERSSKITGSNVEVKLRGKLSTPVTVADGSAELVTVTPDFAADEHGGAVFPLTHYTHTKGIPSSQMRRYKGKEAKTDGFYEEQLEGIILAYEALWRTALHSTTFTTAIGRTVLGSWCMAVSDGISAGETGDGAKLYGTIDRSDAANIDYRGILDDAGGATTLARIRANVNAADANGGTTDTGIAGTVLYTKIQLLLENYVQITDVSDMTEFGGRYCKYDGVTFTHDQACPSTHIGLLDSSTWGWWSSDDNMTDGVIKDPSRLAGWVIPTESWNQFICLSPNRNVKMKNYT